MPRQSPARRPAAEVAYEAELSFHFSLTDLYEALTNAPQLPPVKQEDAYETSFPPDHPQSARGRGRRCIFRARLERDSRGGRHPRLRPEHPHRYRRPILGRREALP